MKPPPPVPEAAAALLAALAAIVAASTTATAPLDLASFFALLATATAAGAVSGRYSRSTPRVAVSLAAILLAGGLASRLALALLPWQAELFARPRSLARDALLIAISAVGTLAIVVLAPPPFAGAFAAAEVAAATVGLATLALRAAAAHDSGAVVVGGGADRWPWGRVALATLRFAFASAALALLVAALLPRRPEAVDEAEALVDPAAAAAEKDPSPKSPARPRRRGGAVSGEGSRLDPRRAIRLPDPETEAFAVRLVRDGRPLEAAPEDALFRERALDRLEGDVWTHDDSSLALAEDSDDGRDDGYLSLSRRDPGASVLEQSYRFFGSSDRYVVLWPPIALRAESALTDSTGVLVQARRTPIAGSYEATSAARSRPAAEAIERALAPRAGSFAPRDVATPRLPPRVAALARALRSATRTAGEFCQRVEAHVRSAAGYRLAERERLPRDADPIGDLLFEKTPSHCETFAAAMALLCRSGGVPARIAIGYRGAEPAFDDGTFTVLERSRHAWVEARLEGLGWVAFDPTPPRIEGFEPARADAGPLASAPGLAERAVALWDGFDLETQRAALATIAARLVERPFATALVLFGIALAAVARAFALALLARRRAWRAARVGSREEMAIVTALARLRRKLAESGFAAGPASTPRELSRLAAAWPESERAAAAAVVAAHEAARYAGREAAR